MMLPEPGKDRPVRVSHSGCDSLLLELRKNQRHVLTAETKTV